MQMRTHSNELRKQVCLCLFVFSIGIWFLLQTDLENQHHFFIPSTYNLKEAGEFSIISGPGCHIPDLDIYDPSILEALEEEQESPGCDKDFSGFLVKSNITHLYIDYDVQEKLNLTGDLKCCYRPFWRITASSDKHDASVDSSFKYLEECVPFKDSIFVEAVDYVRVECRHGENLIYKDFYSFIPSSYRHKAEDFSARRNISVLVLGIDGVSRLNFKRQMVNTYDYLIKNLHAVEFYGYHKVDDNTFPNLIPVLVGESEKELTKSCWPTVETTFDNCSFIWKDYKDAGFITGFGEDASWMGLFQYGKIGFREQPTDVYLRTYNYVYEKELGHEKRMNANLCVGNKMNIEVLLDAIRKFAIRLSNKLSFGFFWENSLSHDYLNLPRYGDDVHVSLFDQFQQEGVFDKSVVIIMSDHGIRWGKIRTTYQGYVEERLPLLIVSSPHWFRQRFPMAWANFKKNSLRLTTPYDLHETLKDLSDLSVLDDSQIIERSKKLRDRSKMPRGISLFLPIVLERTCEDADIADHWCTCHKDEEVSVNNTQVIKSAQFILDHINTVLESYSQCSQLSLKNILNARIKVLPSENAENDDKAIDSEGRIKEYTVRIEVDPGGGVFEATVQYSPLTNKFRLVGSISRSNTYGSTSYCVSHYKLKLYCYCNL